MKTTISKDVFQRALLNANKFAMGTRAQNENLGVFVTLGKDKLTVLGIQESKFFQEEITCDLDADENTSISLDTKKLSEYLQNLPTTDINLMLEKTGLRISAGKTNALFPIVVKRELPQIPTDRANVVSLDPRVVIGLLPQLLFCVASDSARPTLSSIKCIPHKNNTTLFITTDGFRLSIMHTSLSSTIGKSLQIPAFFMRDVFASVVNVAEGVNLVFHEDGRISIAQGGIVVGTQLVAGEFPPYERVIVKNFKHNLVVSREDFMRSIKTISIFTRDHSNIVVCEIGNESIRIRPKKEAGEENNTELSVETQGENAHGMVLAFNYKYVLDFLASVEDDFVTVRVNRADSPVLFLPGRMDAADSHEGAAYQHIIMPVRIQE